MFLKATKNARKINIASFISTIILSSHVASTGHAQGIDIKFIDDAKINYFNRSRYETVDQEGFSDNASALTMRNRLTLTSGKQNGFQASIEGEAVTHLNSHFNDTMNGNSNYPVIADPEEIEINQMWLSYDGIEDTTIKIGRQRINLGGQRFVGGVGWRQNEQTFDAARITNKSVKDLTLDYTYINKVNRIFGDDHPSGKFDSDSHLFNGSYAGLSVGTITTYAYLLDFENALANSTKTLGVRFKGKQPLPNRKASITYSVEYANQTNYKMNPLEFNLSYINASLGAVTGDLMFAIGYEKMGGNGSKGFSTPLATLHKFNGFVDVFLSTPTSGIIDLNATSSYSWKNIGFIKSLKLQAWYHDFKSDFGPSVSLGKEVDIQLVAGFDKGFTIGAKLASYKGDDFTADRNKAWLWMQYSF